MPEKNCEEAYATGQASAIADVAKMLGLASICCAVTAIDVAREVDRLRKVDEALLACGQARAEEKRTQEDVDESACTWRLAYAVAQTETKRLLALADKRASG